MKSSPDENVTLVSGDAISFVQKLKEDQALDIWLCGGARLAVTLFPEIDEIIVKSNPFLLGSGIPLFSSPVAQTDLELKASKVYTNGFMLLEFIVKH